VIDGVVKGIHWLLAITRTAAAIFLISSVAINFVNIIGRYFFSVSIPWAEEIMLFLMVGCVFTGCCAVAWEGRQIRMDVAIGMLPPKLRELVDALSELVRANFNRRFWNADLECCFDVVEDHGTDPSVRPNQIFAVSLANSPLGDAQQSAVVEVVRRELLTPMGLRTLSRSDPNYKGKYSGPQVQRDAAYHNGTVWPWLMGPFVEAYLCAYGKTPGTMHYCRGLVERFAEAVTRGPCLGSVPEIFDGEGPYIARGCPAQAWSVAELARVKWLLRETPRGML